MFIPDPGSIQIRIRIKEFKYFNPKQFQSTQSIPDPGSPVLITSIASERSGPVSDREGFLRVWSDEAKKFPGLPDPDPQQYH